ncbi:peptide deformylase [Sphingosinicellaceae bacterium]|nr:peptide deformylase [Sphingosinicellaceae bacterium]
MAIRDIIEAPDPYLRTISTPVEAVDDEVRTLVADMFETMYDAPGIGLAAIQVGVAKRVLVIDLQPDPEPVEGVEPANQERIREPRVFINPVITWESDELSSYNEGCLSVPELYGDVERPAKVHATWLDETGAAHDEDIDGMLATCLQHEMDHLNGVLFYDHLSKLKRDMIVKKLTKAQRKAA